MVLDEKTVLECIPRTGPGTSFAYVCKKIIKLQGHAIHSDVLSIINKLKLDGLIIEFIFRGKTYWRLRPKYYDR